MFSSHGNEREKWGEDSCCLPTHADGAYTSYVYDAHGRVTEQTGSADYPVRYTYDSTDGWMTHMKTYRDSDGDPLTGTAGNGSYESDTEWIYDTAI